MTNRPIRGRQRGSVSNGIRFILNGQAREVRDAAPTTTVLDYLRTAEHLTGTKEGCAEGDCGACTVVLGELDGGRVRYRAVNACILFVPVLDGRELITVEHLKTLAGGELHPVQQTLVQRHGSQCGFCTPGFAMSLFALFHERENYTQTEIQDAIAGNLCRCTGYRPILDAARDADRLPRPALPDPIAALETLQRDTVFSYTRPEGEFHAPRTLDELAALLDRRPEATVLAGGTDVGLWVTKQHRELPVLVYTGHVRELHRLEQTAEGLEIGAAVSWTDAFGALARIDDSLEDLLRRFASVQIRNSATVGGNIANGSPIGDGMPALIALGAKLVLRSAQGARTLALEDYYLAYGKQDRRPGEFVEKLIVPAKPESVLFRIWKVSKRFDQDISAVCGAFALELRPEAEGLLSPAGQRVVASARIAFGGMAATPRRARQAEATLVGQPLNEATLAAAMAAMDEDFTPIDDMRASARYRRIAARNLLRRLFIEATQPDTETRVYRHAG